MGFQVTEVQKALKGVDYPADRDDLVAQARRNGASEELVRALGRAAGERFDAPTDVMRAMSDSLGRADGAG
jgi:hypothetical protein